MLVLIQQLLRSRLTDLISEDESLHKKYDFDLVSENSKVIDSKTTSDEVFFENRILTDYIKSDTNRAISIDSVSDQFNDLPRPTPYSDIADFDTYRSKKCQILWPYLIEDILARKKLYKLT